MSVKIGSARSDENGKANGKPGDQKSGKEVSTQSWYLHKKGWVIIRIRDSQKAEKNAWAMEKACENPHFGYGQADRNTGYNAAKAVGFDPSKVKKNVNIDCSKLVQLCLAYAGITVPDWYTGNMKSICKGMPKTFEVIEGAKAQTSDYLLRGDILVTKTKGHTVIVLSNGAKAKRAAQETEKAGKTAVEVAAEVLAGEWGNGEDRKKRLQAAGYDYVAVQSAVNSLIIRNKTAEAVAKEVLAGKWGNGEDRKKRLQAAGYDVEAIQAKVNELAGT